MLDTPDKCAAYLAALVDGEGHIGIHPLASGHWARSISVCNTEPAILDAMIHCCRLLSIPTRRHAGTAQNNEAWSPREIVYVKGGRPSFEMFAKLIPLQSLAKRAAMARLLDSYIEVPLRCRNGTTTACETCGKEVYSSRAFRLRGNGKFCSTQCHGVSMRKRVAVTCITCGIAFEVKASQIAKGYGRFCSKRCTGKAKADRMRAMAKMAGAARWKHKVRVGAP